VDLDDLDGGPGPDEPGTLGRDLDGLREVGGGRGVRVETTVVARPRQPDRGGAAERWDPDLRRDAGRVGGGAAPVDRPERARRARAATARPISR